MRATLLLAILAMGAADVYRWVDSQGVIHFSDRPTPGAERIVIESAPSPGPPAAPAASSDSSSAGGQPQETSFRYDAITIKSPTQDQVLWNIGGQLNVSAKVEPTLRPGHLLQLLLDDQAVETFPPGSTAGQLSAVPRGTHTLRAVILDASGTKLLQSPAVGFVVHQTSMANPQNPQVLRPTPR